MADRRLVVRHGRILATGPSGVKRRREPSRWPEPSLRLPDMSRGLVSWPSSAGSLSHQRLSRRRQAAAWTAFFNFGAVFSFGGQVARAVGRGAATGLEFYVPLWVFPPRTR
jgi:hypothetical protein